MKKFIVCIPAFFFLACLFAQSTDSNPLAKKATEYITLLYNLDGEQQKEMLKIQERKFQNLEEIRHYKTEDPKMYSKKIEALIIGNDWSIQNLLHKDQLIIFKQKQIELRNRKALIYKELKEAGVSQPEIEKKILELELELLQQ